MASATKTNGKATRYQPVPMGEFTQEVEAFCRDRKLGGVMISNVRWGCRFLVEDAEVRTTAKLNNELFARLPAIMEEKYPRYKPGTMRFKLGILLRICNIGYSELGRLLEEPVFPVMPHPRTFCNPERPSLPTRDELKRFLGQLEANAKTRGRLVADTETLKQRRIHVLAQTIGRTGLGRDETIDMRRGHIDLEQGTIHDLPRAHKPRSTLPTTIRISAELRAILAEWLDDLPADCDFVFPGNRLSRPWRSHGHGDEALQQLRAAARAAEIDKPMNFRVLQDCFEAYSVPSMPFLDDPGGTGKAAVPAAPVKPAADGCGRLAPVH
jgi:integrase